MMLVGVGAVMSMPATIGMFVGTNAETLPAHIIGSSVSGLMHDINIVFFSRNSSASFFVSIIFPDESALAANALTS